MNNLIVTVIGSDDDWQKLAPQWNALLDESASASVFLTWEWLSAWAECCLAENRRLFIVTFHEKDTLLGIAPFHINCNKTGIFTVREIRFLGAPEAGSDYLDVFSRRGREKDVTDALYDFLMGEGKQAWDVMRLQDIPADALFLLHFLKRIQAEGKFAEIAYSSYCPVANLRGAEDGFPLNISLRRKKRFKQELGILSRETNVEHAVIKGNRTDGFEEFFRLYEEKSGRPGKNLRSILQCFSGRCNGDSPIKIDLLSVNGQAVAGLLHLQYKNTIAIYLMAVDKEFNPKISLGNLLVGKCIKNSIDEGYEAYDFLKGEESYKFHWSTEGRSTMQLNFWQKRPVALISGLSELLRHAGKLLLR